MAICQRCGKQGLLEIDLYDNVGCVYCYGVELFVKGERVDKVVKCSRCGATNLLESDLCGISGCVHCYGVDLAPSNSCTDCGVSLEGKSVYISSNGEQCFSCYKSK